MRLYNKRCGLFHLKFSKLSVADCDGLQWLVQVVCVACVHYGEMSTGTERVTEAAPASCTSAQYTVLRPVSLAR